jgi:hypothetical protein
VGPGTITAGNERRGLALYALQRRYSVLAIDACRIVFRPDDHKIVVHDRITFHTKSFGKELLLGLFSVHEHDIGIATTRRVERLTGALSQDLHLNARLLLYDRQEVAKQAGVLRRGGRCNDNYLENSFVSCLKLLQ